MVDKPEKVFQRVSSLSFCQHLSLIWFVLWLQWGTDGAVVHLYVSPSGSDSNTGLQSSTPVKSLQHAVDLLQSKDIQGNTIFVELMQGYYDLTSTLTFAHAINGTAVFRAFQGQEVHLTGGRHILSDHFKHVTDTKVQQRLHEVVRTKVLELDLTAVGITNLGSLTTYGIRRSTWTAPLELFINGKPLRLAQWPNEKFINILSVPDGEKGRRFTYNAGGRDVAWTQETEPWVYGWWYWSWADESLPVAHVDAHNHTITLAQDSQFGVHVGHYIPGFPTGGSQQGGYFQVINMLSELDEPGEYYIDRTSKKLYLWPNTPLQTLTSSDIVYVSMLSRCIRIESVAQKLNFEDFTVENCRQHGVSIASGHDITFKNMEIKNTGSYAINCEGDCRRVSVLASEIHDTCGGVLIKGGDPKTLTSSEVLLQDNHVWDFSRTAAIPCNAFEIGGIHVTVSHNYIHHGQYTGILWTGNDHVIEYNHVHHMCWNSSDCGAIHSTLDWTWRGNIIRKNHIHHTLRYFPGADVRGIMLDDEYSSVLIEGNVFYDNEVHANIGGGRDNIIRQNVMYNATKSSIQVDGRGLGSTGHGVYLTQKLQRSFFNTTLWKSRYPELAAILLKHPSAPEGNQIYDNIFYNPRGIERIHYSGSNLERKDYFDVHNNFRAYSPGDFWSPKDADFRLRCNAVQWADEEQFPSPVSVDDVGPQVPTGPNYLRARRHPASARTTAVPVACDSSTVVPATTAPRGSYMPDGSSPNTLYPNIPKEGCWFVVDHCPKAPAAEGTHKDDIGTQAGTEEGCLARAAQQWRYCGSSPTGQVVAVYGPTGAMTVAGDGCFSAEYGCRTQNPGFHRDTWAEQHQNASHDEAACLARAAAQWTFCGSHADRPITSIYRPTGHFRTAGAGCWIKILSCPADHTLQGYFYDAWGATNLATDHDRDECLDRADRFWKQCGSHDNAPVTAFYRPSGASRTVP
ncbi:uncharacterized protein LOC112563338 [Pomacea canaliculata]|uniref:uncharacterized protein LOC112563338 n=1 Tax=Pomacea canaliculata TaxID=400727 RepID=UPI000D73C438|nr:uncharacterized protein LOC112563338 [Pomacea canaliculata]